MVGRDGDCGCNHGRGRVQKGRPRLSTGHLIDLHADPYTLVGPPSGMTALTNGRPPPIATTIPSRQEPQIHLMPTPALSRAGSCGKRQTTTNSTQDIQGQGTSTATGHSSTSAPKLRYDGAKCWHPPKPGLKHISQVFKENYNKSWLSFDEADDDTRKIWWTEWRLNFNYYITVINSIKLYGTVHVYHT
ncbi:hypothetical protein AHAS_Ahas19G0259500 [Arachis hypogaea]